MRKKENQKIKMLIMNSFFKKYDSDLGENDEFMICNNYKKT